MVITWLTIGGICLAIALTVILVIVSNADRGSHSIPISTSTSATTTSATTTAAPSPPLCKGANISGLHGSAACFCLYGGRCLQHFHCEGSLTECQELNCGEHSLEMTQSVTSFFNIRREIDISTLVIFAALAAAFQGERADAALVVLLFNLSKVVESIALNRVSSALRAVLQLQAVHTVHLVDGKACPVSELKPGDVIALRPGEECPADGLVSKGAASCSEAALSGESHPLHKQQGDLISSGAVVLNGYVEVMLTTASSQSAVSMIEAQVEEAQMKRTDRQLMIQRFARWWTPGIVIVVLMMCTLVPLAFGDFQTWSRRGLVILLTACPCAIVIGAPLATTSAIAAAASYGLLIKRPESVEKLPQIATVALDKTGTLTKGELSVLHVENFDPSSNLDQETALKWAAALELRSAHPIAAAVVSKALGCIGDALESQELPTVSDFRVLPGIGIQGYIENNMGQLCKVVLGNKRALEVATACPTAHSKFIAFEEQFSQHSTVAMLVDGKLQLGLALNDTIREDSAKLLEELNVMGFKSTMLTGDTEEAAAFVAESLGIPQDLCHFAMTPEQKRQWVSEREAEGRHVLMLGDGINDATALAVAHVGVAMGETGAALAAQSADIVMMTDKLYRLPQCIRLCRFARRIERLNIAIPCLLKLLQASVAMFVDLKLWIVVLADLGTLLLALLLGVSILSPNFWSSGGFLTVSRIRRFRRRLRQYEQFG
eukprot:Skav223797  [mRNA]  locus=scaffold575:558629:567689:+ [translate_table: standard]